MNKKQTAKKCKIAYQKIIQKTVQRNIQKVFQSK